jgi:hypothetical protein
MRDIVVIVGKDMNKECLVIFVDLDATLTDSTINNTYDYIKAYYLWCLRNKFLAEAILEIVKGIALILILIMRKLHLSSIDLDTLLIDVLFLGHNTRMHHAFSLYWTYILLTRRKINIRVLALLENLKRLCITRKHCEIYLFTCCTEYPACIIANKLSMKCLAREFKSLGEIIIGLKDKGACWVVKGIKLLKIIFTYSLKKLNCAFIYITDRASAYHEGKLLKLFNKVVIINEPDHKICDRNSALSL